MAMPDPSRHTRDGDPTSTNEDQLPILLAAAAKGDEEAWRGIVSLYARRVYALARSRLGARNGGRGSRGRSHKGDIWGQGNDAAEEVTQSVFVTVASKLSTGEYTEQGRFESWLFRVAMNRIRDEVRRVKRHAETMDPETMAASMAAPSGDETSDLPENLRSLRSAMGLLSDADREIVELRHHAGLSFKQMAELLSEPIGTLLARHHRALKKLKEIMSGPSEPNSQGIVT